MTDAEAKDREILFSEVLKYRREAETARAEVARLRSRVAELTVLVKEADDALTWAKGRSPEAAVEMVKDAGPWQVRARRALTSPSETRPRLTWQCSGCHWGFSGTWQKVCPCCGREDYWTGSVSPDAKPWTPAPSETRPEQPTIHSSDDEIKSMRDRAAEIAGRVNHWGPGLARDIRSLPLRAPSETREPEGTP